MRLMVDTSRATFVVAKESEPKTEPGKTQQKTDANGQPQWVVQLFAMDESGGEVIRVTVAGVQPKVSQGQCAPDSRNDTDLLSTWPPDVVYVKGKHSGQRSMTWTLTRAGFT